MGAIQGSINSMLSTTAAATALKKHFGNQEKIASSVDMGRYSAGGVNFSELNAEQAFIKSNEALVAELTKKRAGLLRVKRMLEKTGKWGDAQVNRLSNLEAEIKRYSSAGSEVQEHVEATITKLGKGSSTVLEEDKK